jgi:hypothetical protein
VNVAEVAELVHEVRSVSFDAMRFHLLDFLSVGEEKLS